MRLHGVRKTFFDHWTRLTNCLGGLSGDSPSLRFAYVLRKENVRQSLTLRVIQVNKFQELHVGT